MKKEKATILLLTKNQKPIRPGKVSGNVILNWRKYVFSFLIVILTLAGVIGYLLQDRSQQIKVQEDLQSTIKELHLSFAELDTSAIRERFQNIDKELETINNYLRERGIKKVLTIPQGGEDETESLSAAEKGEFYEEYLKKLSFDLASIPLGYPFYGKITSSYGFRDNPFGKRNVEAHKGLDIRAPMGAPVKAMAKGVVTFAGRNGGYGNCIVVKHANGYETLYGHLSKILVSKGQQIEIGQQIGKVGSTGRSTGPHLHYEVHRNGKKVNPKSYLTLN
ncbi:MAG: M23 family metallopeptidase [Chitinophagaceae bacterium]|nr:M23 family metallopeptidase [Chitinophagaceae bacterium]